MRWWGGRSVMSSPKKRTRPDVGGKSPVIALNRVVLPAPLAPMTARRSPAATSSEMSSIATSAPKVRPTPASDRAWVAPTRPGSAAIIPATPDARTLRALLPYMHWGLHALRIIAPHGPELQELV